MKINLFECLDGFAMANGLMVVIDVFRAFSVGCHVMDRGAARYLAVDTVEKSRALAKELDGVLVGERGCVKVDGFDYGNSPTEIKGADLTGRTVVHTTSAGTQGLIAAMAKSDHVITGAFVNAGAISRYISTSGADEVSLMAMGTAGRERSLEDTMCAIYIKNEVERYPNTFKVLKEHLATIPAAEKFFDESADCAPERDFELCMDLDRFSFVLKGSPGPEGSVELTRVDVA